MQLLYAVKCMVTHGYGFYHTSNLFTNTDFLDFQCSIKATTYSVNRFIILLNFLCDTVEQFAIYIEKNNETSGIAYLAQFKLNISANQTCHNMTEPGQNSADAQGLGSILVRLWHIIAYLNGCFPRPSYIYRRMFVNLTYQIIFSW